MITVTYYETVHTADKAVRMGDAIIFYNGDNEETERISGIQNRDWLHVSIVGEWTDPSEIPTVEERLRADVDYLTMENEYLEGESEQARADIDYLLMITEEA